jgi:hypothetical protein
VLQAQRQDAEIQRLTAALAAAPREDPSAPNTRQALQKMAAEVSWQNKLSFEANAVASEVQSDRVGSWLQSVWLLCARAVMACAAAAVHTANSVC